MGKGKKGKGKGKGKKDPSEQIDPPKPGPPQSKPSHPEPSQAGPSQSLPSPSQSESLHCLQSPSQPEPVLSWRREAESTQDSLGPPLGAPLRSTRGRGRGVARGRALGAFPELPNPSGPLHSLPSPCQLLSSKYLGPSPTWGVPKQLAQDQSTPCPSVQRPEAVIVQEPSECSRKAAPVASPSYQKRETPPMYKVSSSLGRGQRPSGRGVTPDQTLGSDVVKRMETVSVGRGRGSSSSRGGGGQARVGSGQPGRKNAERDIRVVNPYLKTKSETLKTKKGSFGKQVKILSNYFPITTHPNWCLYQYRVDCTPEEERTWIKQALMRVHRTKMGGYLFDGTVLYTWNRLHPEPLVLHSFRDDSSTIKFTLKLVGDLAPGEHAYIQVFNIIMRRCYANMDLQLVGRDFYDPKMKINLPGAKLQIWPGYITTIGQYESSILMVVEITHKVIRLDTVLNVMQEFMKNSHTWRINFESEVVGAVVLTDYNNKTYTISDIAWDLKPSSKFNTKGTDIAYMEYYKTKYNIRICDMNQPMLVVKARARDIRAGMAAFIYLVPELCRMTGLTSAMRENTSLMRELAKHTRVGPQQRVDQLLKFNARLNNTRQTVTDLKEWDMGVSRNLVTISGRQLPTETIVQGSGGTCSYSAGGSFDGWTKELRTRHMLSCVKVLRWAVIVPQRMRKEVDSFIWAISRSGARMGFVLPQPTIAEIPTDQIPIYIERLEQVIAQINPSIIVCAVTNDRADRYAAIKKKCCVDRAVPTQVVTARSIVHKNIESIAMKIAIQINCKVGGAPWSLPMPLSNLMIVGYDVCHDVNNRNKSFGSMVASLDKGITRFFSSVTPHANGEELSNEFGLNMKKALRRYKEVNNTLPEHIIIYRDGVGDGQIPYVHNHEVEIVKKALAEIYNGARIKMGFIIVSKRLNTRFISADTYCNPQPGTVIDDVVTSPERYDFFLVSQAVRDGTVSPTSYNIIYDTLGLSPDQIQRLSYKLCHLYYNFSGQVRVPAPCQYAHKLAYLAGQHLKVATNPGMGDLLYFL